MESDTLTGDHVCNLNDGIHLSFGEDPFATSTFDVKTEDAKGRYLRPFAFRLVGNEIIVTGSLSIFGRSKLDDRPSLDCKFDLTSRFSVVRL